MPEQERGLRPLAAAGQLAGLWALAVVRPLLEVLAPGEELVLVAWTGLDIVLFAIGLALLPPLAMVAVELAAQRIRTGWGWRVHLGFVGALAGSFAMFVARSQAGAGDLWLTGAGAAAAVGAGLAYRHFAGFRSLLTVLSVTPLVTVVLFLLASPAAELVSAQAPRPAPHGAAPTPVVLVVFDELPTLSLMRPDRSLDASAYPNLAALAADGTWFRNATSPHDFTRISVPAILTGRVVRGDRAPSLAAYSDNLFTVLTGSHAVHAVESVTRLCPPAQCPNNAPGPFPQRVTRVLPALARVSASTFVPQALLRRLPVTHPLGTSAPQSEAARFRGVGRAVGAERRPGLFYVHAFLPHGPWSRLPSGQSYPLSGCCLQDAFPGNPGENGTGFGAFGPDRWTRNRFVVAQSRQRHLAQARFADRLLGELLARLRRSGKYERALIVVTADHGIGFGPGRHARRLAAGNLAEVLGVPLFVKAPFQRRGAVSDAFARTTDIAPTVTGVLGLGNPLRSAGSSLVAAPPPPPSRLEVYAVQDRRRRRFAPSELLRQRDRALAGMRDFFGTSGPFGSLYAFGPHQRLIGRRADEVRVLGTSGLAATLDRPAILRRVDPRAPSVPALVSGRLSPAPTASASLAVQLNSRIVAVTQPYRSVSGVTRWTALLPVAGLRAGRNRLALHEIVPGPADRPGLRPLRMRGA